ncbi:MAG: AAA-like domain-containing protein [Pyrinomonadaceae bacterium]
MPNEDIYTVGGTVRLDRGVYIPRQTDEELLAYCRAGLFAYVLTSRQLGKSSLMVHTARRLTAEGKRTAIIDLGQIGTATPEQWYLGVMTNIAEELRLKIDVVSWWSENPGLSVTNRLTAFFEYVLREEVSEPVIIFMDEIDTTLNLEFRDDFFAAIRYFYNARAHKPEFNRLTFVLIGTATPGDLIDDPLRTPFNIGHWVVLSDFTLEEAMPLAKGLGLPNGESEKVMRWILEWTGGHPYLTQRICQVIADHKSKVSSKEAVDSVVANIFLGEKGKYEGNLEFVRDMLTRRMRRTIEPSKLLRAYGKILRGRFVPDEEHSLIKEPSKTFRCRTPRRDGIAGP